MNWAFEQSNLKTTTKFVLVALANYADRDNLAFPSVDALAERCSMEKRSIYRALEELRKAGLIRTQKRWKGGGGQRSSAYQLSCGNVKQASDAWVTPVTQPWVTPVTQKNEAWVTEMHTMGDTSDNFEGPTPLIALTATITPTVTAPKKNSPPPPQKKLAANSKKKSPAKAPITAETWERYADAYHRRYGVDPVRNALVNSCLANFVKRIGQKEAPFVAEFFVSSNKAYYVSCGHSVKALLSDAEALRTQWATGQQITERQARQIDNTQTNFDAISQAKQILARKKDEK